MSVINHHHLYIFWTLARTGSFTRAGEELSIAQSAVTSQIKLLEEALNIQLIDRSNRRKPVLTPEGHRTLEYADEIFESSSELMRWAQGESLQERRVRVGALSGLSRNLQYEFLQPILKMKSVKVEVTTGDQEHLVELLKSHAIDVILSSHNVRSVGSISFFSHVLTSSPVVFVIAAKARLRSASIDDYLRLKKVFIPGPSFEARPELDAFLEKRRQFQIAGEIEDIALLRLFALRSGELVAMPKMGVLNDILARALVVVCKAEKIEQRFYAITRQRRFPSAIVEELIKTLQKAGSSR